MQNFLVHEFLQLISSRDSICFRQTFFLLVFLSLASSSFPLPSVFLRFSSLSSFLLSSFPVFLPPFVLPFSFFLFSFPSFPCLFFLFSPFCPSPFPWGGVWGSGGLGVWGSGVWGSGVWGSRGLGVWGSGIWVWGSGGLRSGVWVWVWRLGSGVEEGAQALFFQRFREFSVIGQKFFTILSSVWLEKKTKLQEICTLVENAEFPRS